MEEIENIKRLLFSEDSRDLGVELAKSLGLVEKVVEDLNNEVKNLLSSFLLESVESWNLTARLKSISYLKGERHVTYHHKIEYRLVNGRPQGINQSVEGSQATYHFVAKRKDLIKKLIKLLKP